MRRRITSSSPHHVDCALVAAASMGAVASCRAVRWPVGIDGEQRFGLWMGMRRTPSAAGKFFQVLQAKVFEE